LPTVQKELISPNCMPMGRCVKFMAIYKRHGPWWRKHNLQGDILACGGLPRHLSVGIPATCSSSRSRSKTANSANNNNNEREEEEEEDRVPLFPYCFDLSPRSQKYGVLCCFLEGVPYQYFQNLSSDKQRQLLTDFLQLSFQDFLLDNDNDNDNHDNNQVSEDESDDSDEIIENDGDGENDGENDGDGDGENQRQQQNHPLWVPDDFIVADWGPDTDYVGGAYTGYFRPGVISQPKYWRAYRQVEKSPNLFWAGADYHAGFGT